MGIEFVIYGLRDNKDETLFLQLNKNGDHSWSGNKMEDSETLKSYLQTCYNVWGKKEYSSPQEFLGEIPITQRISKEISKYQRKYKERGITPFVPEEDLTRLIRDTNPESLIR